MIPPKVTMLGDRNEGEKYRGFGLSQLQILLKSMEFQGLKQYTRVVQFNDGSFVRAFSSFGVNTVTVFVPPVSDFEREVIEVKEDTYIPLEPCEAEIEIYSPDINCVYQWVIKSSGVCVLSGTGTLTNYYCSDCNRSWVYELIVGDKRQVQGTMQSCLNDGFGPGGHDNCIDPDHNPPEEVAWDYYVNNYNECADPVECEGCAATQKVEAVSLYYYEWECA